MTKQEWEKLSFDERAWRLNLIISYFNHEGAYYSSGWLYIWPDGEDREQCKYDFEKEEDYRELEDSFKRNFSYKAYHRAGLYASKGVPQQVIDDAHFWDEQLGLEPIQVIQ